MPHQINSEILYSDHHSRKFIAIATTQAVART